MESKSGDENSWQKNAKLVLHEIQRLSGDVKDIKNDLDDIKITLTKELTLLNERTRREAKIYAAISAAIPTMFLIIYAVITGNTP